MRRLAFAAFLMLAWSALGQTFRVWVELPSDTLSGRATLTILDGTQRRPQYSARVREGQCCFEGQLMEDKPYWAEVRHPALEAPWGFFIEASEIWVAPGRVSGSASDSAHRAHSLERLPEGLFREGDTTVVLFTAPWCGPCQRAADSLAGYGPLLVDVAERPELWDRLALPHIPFLLVADAEGRVLESDLRWWEMKRILKNLKNN